MVNSRWLELYSFLSPSESYMLIALTWGFEAISGKEDEIHVRVLDYLLIVKKIKKEYSKNESRFFF